MNHTLVRVAAILRITLNALGVFSLLLLIPLKLLSAQKVILLSFAASNLLDAILLLVLSFPFLALTFQVKYSKAWRVTGFLFFALLLLESMAMFLRS